MSRPHQERGKSGDHLAGLGGLVVPGRDATPLLQATCWLAGGTGVLQTSVLGTERVACASDAAALRRLARNRHAPARNPLAGT
jgi:hypothetical protein